ncbi:MAG: aromatic ring-hydroxylating dioxygenase subunit alpha [Actinomycetota bacterium]
MRLERQWELLDRIASAGPRMKGLQGPDSVVLPSSVYTDPDRFADEQRLFRRTPAYFGLSADLPAPGDHDTATFGGVPVLVVRQGDGSLRAMVNACRHRGAPVIEPGASGGGLSSIQCQYHAWTYDLDGRLRTRPGAAGAFDDVSINCDLHQVQVVEGHGLIFVRVDPPVGAPALDIDEILAGTRDDFLDFDMVGQTLVERRTRTWDLNWKLILDTFMESYHIRTLHRDTIAPYFNSDSMVYEPFGHHMTATAFRRDILNELDKPPAERRLLPRATVQYFLLPNGLLSHQIDHWEVWRIEPVSIDSTRTVTSIYATTPGGPQPDVDDGVRAHLSKNLQILMSVVGTEDFPMMEQIQANLRSGALPEVVHGRNEPALAHFHRSIQAMLDG